MKRTLLLFISLLFFSNIILGQNKNKSQHLHQICEPTIKKKGDFIIKSFYFNCDNSGYYYVGMWIMNHDKIDRSPQIEILINDRPINKKIRLKSNKYSQLLSENESKALKLKLSKGDNKISFICRDYTPDIIDICVSQLKSEAIISEKNYKNYVDSLSNNKLPENYDDIRNAEIKGNKLKTYTLPNPYGIYFHLFDVDLEYTFNKTLYLQEGENVTIYADVRNSSCDPVIYVFETYSAQNFSMSDDNGGNGFDAKLTFRVPKTESYTFLVCKASNSGTSGTCNIFLKNTTYSNYPVAGTFIHYYHSNNTNMAYFTSCDAPFYTNTFPKLWLLDATPLPHCIVGSDFPVRSGGDHFWYLENGSITQNVYNCQISSSILFGLNPNSIRSTCDVYMGVPDFDNEDYEGYDFLENPDVMKSANATSNYNCWSWAMNRTDISIWPPGDPSTLSHFPNEGTYDELNAYMNLIGYSEVVSLNGEIPDNAELACYFHGYAGQEKFGHIAIRNSPNRYYKGPHPHGYAWESKLGDDERIFHSTPFTLSELYSDIVKYYRKGGKKTSHKLFSNYTLHEAFDNKLAVCDKESLSESEKNLIKSLKQNIQPSIITNFEGLYTKWKNSWNRPPLCWQSNPYAFQNSEAYDKLIKFCKTRKETIPLVIEKLDLDGLKVISLLYHLTYKENEDLYQKTIIEKKEKSYNKSGQFIVRHAYADAIFYSKKLLVKCKSNFKLIKLNIETIVCNVFPNPVKTRAVFEFSLPTNEIVSIDIYNISGTKIETILLNSSISNGSHKIQWQVNNTPPGTYIAKFTIGKNIYTKTFAIKQ